MGAKVAPFGKPWNVSEKTELNPQPNETELSDLTIGVYRPAESNLKERQTDVGK